MICRIGQWGWRRGGQADCRPWPKSFAGLDYTRILTVTFVSTACTWYAKSTSRIVSVKSSLLVSSSDFYSDLLLILYLSNSTNLQIVRQRCCLLPRICYFCRRTDILIVGIGRIASSLRVTVLFNSKLVCAHTMPPLQCLILPPWRSIHLLLTLYLNSAALSLLCIVDLRLERQH